ncbi:MAG: hypothetical protein C0392_16665, partial [Syntrophus sp. (in: bacteria)]|nr:hypothetical protein [Syntrophus sp. (in: bacteria)]
MKDQSKPKQVLIQELASLKPRIEDLERSESERKRAEETLGETKASVVYHDDKPHSVMGIARDITERKQAEDALHLFKDLVKHSSDAIGMSTPEGRHYYQNEAFNRMFGDIGDYPPDTLYVDKEIGKQVFDTIMGGGSWQGEVKMFMKDRTIMDIFLRAYTIQSHDGHIVGLVGLHTDITELKKKQKEIDRLASFPQLNPSMILEVGKDKEIVFCNPAMQSVLNKMRIEDPRIFIPEDIWEIFNATEITIKSKYARELQINDAVFCANIYFTPEFNSLRIYATDITDRKRVEEEKRILEERLQHADKMEAIGTLA